MSLFQSNLRKQIRNLPKFVKFVKIIQYYLILFIRVLSGDAAAARRAHSRRRGQERVGLRATRLKKILLFLESLYDLDDFALRSGTISGELSLLSQKRYIPSTYDMQVEYAEKMTI